MGDRGNIYVIDQYASKDKDELVGTYLYTHYSGSEIEKIAAEGLDTGRTRWGDTQYLTRVLFDTLRGGDTGLTGYGISASIGDNQYPIVVVDDYHQKVWLAAEGTERDKVSQTDKGASVGAGLEDALSFEDFVAKHTAVTA